MTDDQELLTEQEIVPTRILSNRDRDIFLALLDADPEPTEAAKKAAAEYNKGRHEGEKYYFQLPAHNTDASDTQDEDDERTLCAC